MHVYLAAACPQCRSTTSATHTLLVKGNDHLLVLVSIDSDGHPNIADDFAVDDALHFCLLTK